MPANPYDDRKVSLRRPHGNGDFDIVRASYTRRKANETYQTLTCCINRANKCKNVNNCCHVNIYEHDKLHAQLS